MSRVKAAVIVTLLMSLCGNQESVYRMVLVKNHKALWRSLSQKWKGHCVCQTFPNAERDISCGCFLLPLGKAVFPLPYILLA